VMTWPPSGCGGCHRPPLYTNNKLTLALGFKLPEWFDPALLRDDYVPSGVKGMRVRARAVPGHEFGLNLSFHDKTALIAFLRTL